MSSGILKAKQKLGVTFNSDKLGGIDFTKFSKLSMCSAGAGRFWLVQWPGVPPRHFTWSVLNFLKKQCRLAYRNYEFYLVFASLSKSLTTWPHLVHKLFWMWKTISVHIMFSPCSELEIFMYWTCNSMNNLLSYCGLVDAKIRDDKDLPVPSINSF